MSLDEIRTAVIEEFVTKLQDIKNQISSVTNTINSLENEIEQLESRLVDTKALRNSSVQSRNRLQRREQVLQESIDKLNSGDIVIRNKP